MSADKVQISGSAGHCEALVRQFDRDRYLADLFAPAEKRPALFALHAFAVEIARVRELVSGPMPGEVRLQWWHDVLGGEARGDVAAHPVASALVAAIARHRLPAQPFLDLIEARRFDLYDDPMPTLTDLEGYCGETASAVIRLACLILADGGDPGSPDAAGHVGVAHALTGLMRALPHHAARGQIYLPGDVLDRHGVRRDDILTGTFTPALASALAELRGVARGHLDRGRVFAADLPAAVRPAFLLVALAEPSLRRMERPGYDPFRTAIEIPQWRRQWLLWRAARRG